ncbi:MAG TPA: hypothetical protein DHW63_06980 [Hyphomonadaceae bacterium]|nr:hypothetical protein [Hyphomonadaceae bacterium]
MTDQSRVQLHVENNSSIGQFLWIGFYSALLAIPTLTLFRFWERTIVRRHLWGETTIGGEPLEYTGKGSELLVGFLIAIFTVVLPLSIALVAVQLLLPPEALLAVVLLAIYPIMFVLIGMAIFLVRRYQLSRTVWRGVRFEQQGSSWSFGFLTLGYILLTIITLGWFGPAMQLRLEKRLWDNAYFGDMKFSYDNSKEARTEPVYVSYILAYVGIVLFYAAFIGVGMMSGFFEYGSAPGIEQILILYAAIFGGAFLLIFFVAWHQAALIRQVTKSISLGDVKLKSRLGAWDIIELAITNTLLIIFTLGIGLLAAQMRVWRRICRKLEVEGELDVARIQQAASRGPGSGEGMADAFDLSGGL